MKVSKVFSSPSFIFTVHGAGLAAHVAVGGRLAEDGVAQAEALHNGVGAQVEQLVYLVGNFAVGEGLAVGVLALVVP